MNNSKGLGNILEIKNKFLASKNIYTNLDENAESIEWNYNSPNGGLKCRVDEKNYLNVFLLTSFEPSNLKNDLNFIAQCMNLFYSNDYKILGIVSNSLGGSDIISYFLTQLLQPKIYLKYNMAQRVNSFIELFIYYYYNEILDSDTCLPFDDLNSFIYQEKDNYGNSVIHNRTKIYNMISKSLIKQINDIRERLLKEGNPKKPTDILIFTDYISSGAAGLFIKGLQENGGAITAGYKGNPKSDEIFDASQSPSSITWFYDSDIYNNLENCGFNIVEITYYQSFNHSYQAKNPTPREFTIFPVDERVNIYHKYNDTYYDEFIDKALEIFDKYNKDNKCNKDNKLLTLDPNDGKNCYVFDNDEHAHGGYICGDNGVWTQECVPYYCDLGYIFDTYQKKCVEDVCTKEDQDTTDGKNTDTTDGGYTDLTDKGNTDGKEDGTNEFPVYAIVLISVGGVAFIILLIVVIFKCCLKKDQINSESIGPLEQGNKDANVELAEREV